MRTERIPVTQSQRNLLHRTQRTEFDELIKEIETEYGNFLKGNNEVKVVALARAEILFNTLEKSHDELWKYGEIDERRDIRILKTEAGEKITKIKGKLPVTVTKISGTAKPKLGLPKFDGDQMRYFSWLKQWQSYDGDESISYMEKARLLLQCITGKAKEAVQDLPFSDGSYKNILKRLEERYGSKSKT
jgi:hypothetical protein